MQLTENPIATGAKGPRLPDAPRSPTGVIRGDFETHLGQAMTPVSVSEAEERSATRSYVQPVSETLLTALPLDRLSRIEAKISVPAQPGNFEKAPLEPAATDLAVALTFTYNTLLVAKTHRSEDGLVTDDIGHKNMELNIDLDTTTARTVSLDTETDPMPVMLGLPSSNMLDSGIPQPILGTSSEQKIKTSTDAIMVAQASSPMLPGLLPSDITDNYHSQKTSRIPSEQKIKINLDPIIVTQAPSPMLPDTFAPEFNEMAKLPEENTYPLELPLEINLSTQINTRIAQPEGASSDSNVFLLSAAEANMQSKTDVIAIAQSPDQLAGDATFPRVLTEVSVAPVSITTPAQNTQAGSATLHTQQPTALDMSQANWAEQLVEDVSLQPMSRGETLTLTLTPERLGTMQVRLEMQDGQTHVHFITETPETARLLTDAQPRLADLMSRAGVELSSQSASTGQDTQQGHHGNWKVPIPIDSSHPTPETIPETTTRSSDFTAPHSNFDIVA